MPSNTNGPTHRLDPSGSRHLRTLWTLGAVGGMSDADLLAQFVAGTTGRADLDAAELAFGAIVDRHGGTVVRVARTILGDEAASLDASQATFLLLAQKARRLRVGESLAPWLTSVARRVALGARRAQTRRQRHESAAARPELVADPETHTGNETVRVVLAEVERLPEPFRAAVVACHLDGLTQHDAAARLGWPVGTLQSRLDRGRRQLRDRLTRRGLAPSALSLVPTSGLNLSIPPTLATTLARTAPLWLIQAAPSTLITPSVLALVSPTAKGTATMKLVAAALTLTAALGVVTTTHIGPRVGPARGPSAAVAMVPTHAGRVEDVTIDGFRYPAPAHLAAAVRLPAPPVPPPAEASKPAGESPIPPPAAGAGLPTLLAFVNAADTRAAPLAGWERLTAKGYPLREVDVRHAPDLKERYQIESLPTIVLINVTGHEVARLEGDLRPDRVAGFYNNYWSEVGASRLTRTDDPIPPPAASNGLSKLICFPTDAEPHPDLGRLAAAKYPVEIYDLQVNADVARHLLVTSAPTYVVVTGDENRLNYARLTGTMTTRQLADQYNARHLPPTLTGAVPPDDPAMIAMPPPGQATPPSEPESRYIRPDGPVALTTPPLARESIPPPGRSDDLTTLLCFPAQVVSTAIHPAPNLLQLFDLGYPIRKVAGDDDQAFARRFGITSRPAYLIVDGAGKGVSKAGDLTTRQLADFYNENLRYLEAAQTEGWGQFSADRLQSKREPNPVPASPPTEPPLKLLPSTPRPWESGVRVRVRVTLDDYETVSGTVIASTPEATYILTVSGPIEKLGQVANNNHVTWITVDRFDAKLDGSNPPRAQCIQRDYPARNVACDPGRGLALLRFEPGEILPVARLAPDFSAAQMGMNLVAVGCSKGRDLTAWSTTVLSTVHRPGRGLNLNFLDCAHRPAPGRFGGGLFTPGGLLVGVCSVAVGPSSDSGRYIGLDTVKDFLKSVDGPWLKTSMSQLYGKADEATRPAETTPPAPGRSNSTQWPASEVNPDTKTPPPSAQDPRLGDLERKLDRIIERLGPAAAAEPALQAPAITSEPGVIAPDAAGEIVVEPRPDVGAGIDDGIVVPLSPEQLQGSGPAAPHAQSFRAETQIGADGREQTVIVPVPPQEPALGTLPTPEPGTAPPVSGDHERRLRDLERKLDRVLESLDNIRGRLEPKPSPTPKFET